MQENERSGEQPWFDPDDAPVLDADFFRNAGLYKGNRLLRGAMNQPLSPAEDPAPSRTGS